MVKKIEKDKAQTRKTIEEEIGPLIKPLMKARGELNGRQEVTLGVGSNDGET